VAQIDHEIINKVQLFIRRLKEEGITIESAYLFGSHAVNRASRWSDIDVAVVSPDFSSDRFDARLRLMKLSTEIDTRIESVPYHVNDFQDTDPLVDEILTRGIKLTA